MPPHYDAEIDSLIQETLETKRANEPLSRYSSDNVYFYEIIPIGTQYMAQNLFCRDFSILIVNAGNNYNSKGRACKDPVSGVWLKDESKKNN